MPLVVLLMGVSGSGKTVVGRRLAAALHGRFLDADDLHPAANVARMRDGIPLADADREPWLDAVAREIDRAAGDDERLVVACSALARRHRRRLGLPHPQVRLVHLDGPPELIRRRLADRVGHFMPVSLLESQLAALEPPEPDEHAITVDVSAGPAEAVAAAIADRLVVDPFAIERTLRGRLPEVVFAAPRLVRRVIRESLGLPWISHRIPHPTSAALDSRRLADIADDYLALPLDEPATVLLIARPEPGDAGNEPDSIARAYWRRTYHGCLDVAARALVGADALPGSVCTEMLDLIGRVQIAEAAAVLDREGLLADRDDLPEVVAEFIAVFLELRSFAPESVPIWFPALDDPVRLGDDLAHRLDAATLLERCRPAAVGGGPASVLHPPPTGGPPAVQRAESSVGRDAVLLRWRAEHSAARGNNVRAALQAWKAAGGGVAAVDEQVTLLTNRLARAVGLPDPMVDELAGLLGLLVDHSGGSSWTPDARLLYDLQKICVDSERESYRTHLFAWLLSLGRRPLIRPLPCQRRSLVHRHAVAAARRLPGLRLESDAAGKAGRLLAAITERTAASTRSRLRPLIEAAIRDAGLVPDGIVEEAAFDSLVDELLQAVVERGFVSFGLLRDAVSRNQLKLPDLDGPGELVSGDPMLRIDRGLASALDGAYRRAPPYLLLLQAVSAAAFGVTAGRILTTHVLLPFGGSWILLQGAEHVVEPVTAYSLGHPWHPYSTRAMLVIGCLLWTLLHVPSMRAAVGGAARLVAAGLRFVVLGLPVRLLRLPLVAQALRSRPVRLFHRHLLWPLTVTWAGWLLLPHDGAVSRGSPWPPLVLFCVAFPALNSRLGRHLRERVAEGLARAVHQLHAHVVVGLFTWIVDTFRKAIDVVEGMLYAVDEQLRFRTDQSALTLAVKAVLTAAWSLIEAVVRFCVTLLIEPQLNPIKHFPVVTVSHKLLVPMIPVVATQLATATGMEKGLALTAVTFLSTTTPGVFGFLAWELKENWRLYAANRPRTLRPAPVGRHGESMRRLLVPGFHSGTCPKLFGRLRRASARGPASRTLARVRHQLYELADDVAAFVEHDCLALVSRARRFRDLPVRVGVVRLATNRILVPLVADELPGGPLIVELAEQAGVVTSRLATPGWFTALDSDRARVVRLALAGLHALAGADRASEVFVGETAESVADGGVSPVRPIPWIEWRAAWERERLS